MKQAVNLDGSANVAWTIARNMHNACDITFSEDMSGYTDWHFVVRLKKGSDAYVVDLIEGDGITVVNSTSLRVVFDEVTSALKKEKYYYEVFAKDASGKKVPFIRSEEFNVQDYNNDDTTHDVSITVNLGSTVVSVSVTLGGGSMSAEDIVEAIENMTTDEKNRIAVALGPSFLG